MENDLPMKRSPNNSFLKRKFPAGNLAFRKLFEDELKEIYWSEYAIAQVLPKMIKRSTSEKLVTYCYEQLFFIREQVHRTEQIFRIIGCFPQAKKSFAMEGILKEATESLKEIVALVRDAGIVGAARKIIHYEIAAYGSLHVIAGELGLAQARLILMQTLYEKRISESKLINITSEHEIERPPPAPVPLRIVD